MGTYTYFDGALTTSRPLTVEELNEYKKELGNYDINNMYLGFCESNNQLCGPDGEKVSGYVDMEKGFINTVNWFKDRGITLSGRINYTSDYMFSDFVGGGFGAFVVTSENVTYHQLDFNGLKMVSNVIMQF